jgi:hypothetical protein
MYNKKGRSIMTIELQVTETTEIPEEPVKNNYIDNAEFLKELKQLNKTGELSEKLHIMFFDLATNYAHIKSFRNYSYIQDMIVEAYMNCVHVSMKFDAEKYKNPFAYFTVTIHRNFLNFIAKEKKQQTRKWRELKVLYEKYMFEDGIKLNLPVNIIEKMYHEEEKKPSKKPVSTPGTEHEAYWDDNLKELVEKPIKE